MKKFKAFLLMAAVATSAVFTSCEKDDNNGGGSEPTPSVAISAPVGTQTVLPGATVDVTVLAAAANGGKKLETFRVEFAANGAPYTSYNGAFNGNSELNGIGEDTYTFQGSLETLSSPGTIVYRFTAIDKDDLSGSTTLTINVEAQADDINTYTATMAGGQDNATLGSSYASSNNNTYLLAQAKANSSLIDMVYFYGSANLATFAAPSSAEAAQVYSSVSTWTTRNATSFRALNENADSFNAVNTASEIDAKLAGFLPLSQDKANTLEDGDVIGFVTAAGKKGLILVKSINGTQTGSITFDVKVQK